MTTENQVDFHPSRTRTHEKPLKEKIIKVAEIIYQLYERRFIRNQDQLINRIVGQIDTLYSKEIEQEKCQNTLTDEKVTSSVTIWFGQNTLSPVGVGGRNPYYNEDYATLMEIPSPIAVVVEKRKTDAHKYPYYFDIPKFTTNPNLIIIRSALRRYFDLIEKRNHPVATS